MYVRLRLGHCDWTVARTLVGDAGSQPEVFDVGGIEARDLEIFVTVGASILVEMSAEEFKIQDRFNRDDAAVAARLFPKEELADRRLAKLHKKLAEMDIEPHRLDRHHSQKDVICLQSNDAEGTKECEDPVYVMMMLLRPLFPPLCWP
jgi:hypothetical protein